MRAIGERPWAASRLERSARWNALGHGGLTVWLTGLPGAGKSTIAYGAERVLVYGRRAACALDAEQLRHGLNADLGAEPSEHSEEVRRTAEVAALMADAGVVALVAIVSPRRVDRESAREVHERAWLTFLEVHVSTPLKVCESRDPKGHYALARRRRIQGVVGVDVPYEPPRDPEFEIDTTSLSPQVAVSEVLKALGLQLPGLG
jgi:bifunctional enzyme CysN/CysC